MPLPACDDEAALRALEPKCADQESPAARRTVRQLREASQAYREAFMINCANLGLTHLVRCATEAGMPPDLRNALQVPVLVIAAHEGHSLVVTVLLHAGADVNLGDSRGCSARRWLAGWLCAAQNGRSQCAPGFQFPVSSFLTFPC